MMSGVSGPVRKLVYSLLFNENASKIRVYPPADEYVPDALDVL